MLVAVYGTLRLGQGNYSRLLKDTDAEHVGVDHIAGTLFSLGGFPGIITGPNHQGLVEVDVFYLPEPSRDWLLSRLDRLEGYDPTGRPEHCMYLRKWTVTKLGKMVYYYEWNNEPPEDRIISSGNWLDHVAERHQIRVSQRA